MSATIGRCVETSELLSIGDIERRSGLYILGKPGTGKTSLICNIIKQDIKNRNGVFFIDPHGDAINDILDTLDSLTLSISHYAVLDPETDKYTFGINPLKCENIESLRARTDTYTRAFNVFHKIWEENWGVWLQLIVQNTLYTLIEAEDYTLAEVPLFLTDREFREHILSKMKHNLQVVSFWRDFDTKTDKQQQEQIQAALTRINTLLGHPYVRHIIGQKTTTIDFSEIMKDKRILFIKLSAGLPEDIKKFIGTILISELLHAVYKRQERSQFCVFVDEFQNFATDDFARLITESRKFGIATTIAHQERYGQLLENRKILGATQAAGNKVIFQLTPEDAKELATEFAVSPPEPTYNLVIAQDPLTVLLKRGHHNPAMREFIHEMLQPIMNNIEQYKGVASSTSFYKMKHDNIATQYKDFASMSQIDARIGGATSQQWRQYGNIQGALNEAQGAIQKAMQAHNLSQEAIDKLIFFQSVLNKYTSQLQRITQAFLDIQEGRHIPVEGEEWFAIFLYCIMDSMYNMFTNDDVVPIMTFYIYLKYGDPKVARLIPPRMAYKHWREEAERLFLKEGKEIYDRHLNECRESHERKQEARRKDGLEIEPFDEEYLRAFCDEQINNRLRSMRGEKGLMSPTGMEYKCKPPYLAPRVFTEIERKILINSCIDEITKVIGDKDYPKGNPIRNIAILTAACYALLDPKNHIKIRDESVEREPGKRTIADMVNEMIQELSNLPRFTAYAKVLEVQGEMQLTRKEKITTLKLSDDSDSKLFFLYKKAQKDSRSYCQDRSEIEKEINERQESWKKEAKTETKKPRPTNEPPPTDY